jgi:hypothetical protein
MEGILGLLDRDSEGTVGYATTKDATTSKYYNERMLQRKNVTTNSFINRIRMLK